MLTNEKLLHSLDRPDLINKPGMVYEIWEDGEITLTKSGDLYGRRGLHCIVPGFQGVNVPLPTKRAKGHSSMALHENNITLARQLIKNLGGVAEDPYKDCLPGKKLSATELLAEINKRNTIALERGDV